MRSGRNPVFFLIVIGLMFTAGAIIFLGISHAEGEEEVDPATHLGELVLENSSEDFTNTTIILEGNITVGAGGKLSLLDCDLLVNSTVDSRLSVIVMDGGILEMTDSMMTRNASYGFDLDIRENGSFTMVNCSISWMNNAQGEDFGGIVIGSDNVTIDQSTVSNWGDIASAIIINGSSPRIVNSEILGQYYGVRIMNGAFPEFHNTSFTSSYTRGVGLECNASGFLLQECNFSGNHIGIEIMSGDKGRILNSSFYGNRIGIYAPEGNDHEPVISDCAFEENEWCAIYLFGNTTIENCSFLRNGIPTPQGPVGSVILMRDGPDTTVSIRNCDFLRNHNGIVAGNMELLVEGCTFTNNTLNGGTSGILVYGGDADNTILITGSTFSGSARGIGAFDGTNDADIHISNNTIFNCRTGILSINSTLTARENNMSDLEIGIEEHQRESSKLVDNTFTNVTAVKRYIARVVVRLNDSYGIDLAGADVSISSALEHSDFPMNLKTDGRGYVSTNLIWKESTDTDTTVNLFPFNLILEYDGVKDSIRIDDLADLEHNVTLNFLRPDLELSDLKVKSSGFSILSDDVREDEEAEISFTIKNTGEGSATGSTVTVRADGTKIFSDTITLRPGHSKDITFKWTPAEKGKVNILVKVTEPNDLNVSQNSLTVMIDAGGDQGGYYYLVVLLTVLALSALIWWMAGNIEGADEDMAKFWRRMKVSLADLFGSWSRKLSSEDLRESDDSIQFIPNGNIYSWDGESSLSGSGKFAQWSIVDENLLRGNKKDVITVQIKIPLPEPEIVEVEVVPEVEVFEWRTARGKRESMKVDKVTLTKIRHPKMFICSLCDRNFVSVDTSVKCPWCAGKAYFLQDM